MVQFLTDGDSITLNLDDLDFDVARFEELAAGPTPEQLEQALVVYRGDLLDGFDLKEEPFEDWLRVERERLRTLCNRAFWRSSSRIIPQRTVLRHTCGRRRACWLWNR